MMRPSLGDVRLQTLRPPQLNAFYADRLVRQQRGAERHDGAPTVAS
jgi:hypothetical protein